MQEQTAPRAKWPIGVIEKVDLRQAQAIVRIINVDRETRLLFPLEKTFPTQLVTRPVSRLYPFEVPVSETASAQEEISDAITNDGPSDLTADLGTSNQGPPTKKKR